MSDPQSRQSNRPEDDPAFLRWRDTVRRFTLDGETLYLPTGDIPMTAEELKTYWLHLNDKPTPGS
ncbi:hypothetical protein JIG36_40470 [Actinoplanes sp. LDG1-06]|uniref:Uncharacterized protein n=1 Tax=Paractinoplanes ovalisporus TaxID=2810368 RepID=A0ABS2APV1_9ACTN|nr:hypothetical protein [Actinoplanes ovalisporus]MBM2621798.1 hypothetical protein [Actinoplanes ovalisporus]